MKYYINALKEVEKENDNFKLTLSKKEVLDIANEFNRLQEENERLEKRNKEIYDGFIATQEELSDYAIKIEKAVEYIKNESWYCYKDDEEIIDRLAILKLLKILGDDNND